MGFWKDNSLTFGEVFVNATSLEGSVLQHLDTFFGWDTFLGYSLGCLNICYVSFFLLICFLFIKFFY